MPSTNRAAFGADGTTALPFIGRSPMVTTADENTALPPPHSLWSAR